MIQSVSAIEPKLVVTCHEWSRINITVLDNNTLFIEAGTNSKQNLSSGLMGFLSGHKIDKTHPFQDWFIGELWWIGSVDGMVVNIMVSAPVKSQSRFEMR